MDENETLTAEEVEQMEDTPGETAEEAHRVGEYDGIMSAIAELSAKVSAVSDAVSGIADKMGAFSSMMVDAGAEVTDAAADTVEDPSEPDIIEVPNIEDIDLDM